jgi:transcriptional regulator with XRE-family HTH domain
MEPTMNVHVCMAADRQIDPLKIWVATIKQDSGLSWEELAKKIGVAHTTLSRAADEKAPPPNFRTSTIRKLVKFSGIPAPEGYEAPVNYGGMEEQEALRFIGPTDRALSPNQTVWTVNTPLLIAMGYVPGDRFILDQSLTRPRDYDVVIANVYNRQRDDDDTLLRVYLDKYLVTPNFIVDRTRRIRVEDDDPLGLVKIMGTVTASWRDRH